MSDPKPWLVVSASDAGEEGAFEIRRLLIEQGQPRRVAVLCGKEAEPIVAFLRSKGFDARAYASHALLEADLGAGRFDAYVLGWTGSGSKVRPLIPLIRAADSSGPLILLTDRFEPGSTDGADVEAIAATYRAILFDKPTRPVNLYTAIERGLEQA